MEINISNVSPKGAMTIAHLDQKDYAFIICPICSREDESFLLADIRCKRITSLESALCRRCEHRYLRKLPSLEWFRRYYAAAWDTGRSQSVSNCLSPLALAKELLKRLPLAKSAWRLTRRYFSDRPEVRLDWNAMQIFSFLLGVAESNGSYYLAQPDLNKVLEVGCGYRGMLEVFHRKGFHVFGTEASPHRAQRCREKGLNVLNCGIDNFKAIDHLGPFDLAYSVHVLEHIVDPASHLRNLASIIREGGYLYIQVPHLMYEINFFHQCHTPVHCHSFSPRSLSLLLERHGFTPVRMQVDMNIHILARKTPPTGSSFVYLRPCRDTADPDGLLEIFEGLSSQQEEPLTMTWDHAYVQIRRMRDAKVVYTRKIHFNIVPTPYSHSMDFSFHYGQDGLSFPVHFNYSGDRPPIWIKMQ